MQQNFLQIQNSFSTDHYALAVGAPNEGKHNIIQLPQTSDPTPDATDGNIYTKAVGSRTELFYRGDNTSIVPLSSIKAWGAFLMRSTPGAVTVQQSFNVASVTRNSTGNYTVTFTDALRTSEYAVLLSGSINAAFTVGGPLGIASRATSNFVVISRAFGADTGVDDNIPTSFVVFEN